MSDLIWIRSTVEAGNNVDEDFISISRTKWEAMTNQKREDYMVDIAVNHQNNVAPCGASVVDESEVPDWAKEAGW